MIVKMKTNI